MTDQPQSASPSRGPLASPDRRALLRNIGINVALPWLAIQFLRHNLGIDTVPAFAAASLFPIVQIGASWIRYRRIEVIGLAVLFAILANIAIAFATNDVRFALLKGSPAFGLFGFACFVSLLGRRPLMFFVSRYFTSGGDAAKAAAWTARLAQDGFRRSMRHLTLIWGTACLVEAALCVCAAFLLQPEIAVIVVPVLGIGTIAGLLVWTTGYSQRRGTPLAAPATQA